MKVWKLTKLIIGLYHMICEHITKNKFMVPRNVTKTLYHILTIQSILYTLDGSGNHNERPAGSAEKLGVPPKPSKTYGLSSYIIMFPGKLAILAYIPSGYFT